MTGVFLERPRTYGPVVTQITSPPLTDDEFARLSGFLDTIGPSAMNIEMLDGYFAALICGPDMVPPSEYLPQIWGKDFGFESDEQATEIMSLLMRHWNTIATELRHTLDKPDVYLPGFSKETMALRPATIGPTASCAASRHARQAGANSSTTRIMAGPCCRS